MKENFERHSKIGRSARSSFGHNPASIERDKQQSLFGPPVDPIAELAESLRKRYSGQTILFGALYAEHHQTSNHIQTHYKQAIRLLLTKEQAFADEEAATPVRKNSQGELSIPDSLKIRFL
jgi:hypothetical protein